MKYSLFIFSILFVAIIMSCSNPPKPKTISKYPVSAKVDTVDNYFGEAVPDPYRWMENDTTKQVADWVTSQNEVTFGFLEKIPYREQIKKRLEALNNYEKVGSPFKRGDYIYFYKNEGLQNHSVLFRKKGEQGEAEVFLDPNTFSTPPQSHSGKAPRPIKRASSPKDWSPGPPVNDLEEVAQG